MKIIDILNKIATGEKVPIFYYEGHKYKYSKEDAWFDNVYHDDMIKDHIYLCELNDEIEIENINEKKEIERINNAYYHEEQAVQNEIFQRKINEIIDFINKEKQ